MHVTHLQSTGAVVHGAVGDVLAVLDHAVHDVPSVGVLSIASTVLDFGVEARNTDIEVLAAACFNERGGKTGAISVVSLVNTNTGHGDVVVG